jgi:hypothetical protein
MRYQVVVVLLVVGAVLAPGDEPAPVQYEGLWERRVQSAAEVPDSVYLSIQDVGQSRYIVVSHCNYYELLSFAAGGRVDSQGVLRVVTDDGLALAIGFGHSRRFGVTLVILDDSLSETIATLYRYGTSDAGWPF